MVGHSRLTASSVDGLNWTGGNRSGGELNLSGLQPKQLPLARPLDRWIDQPGVVKLAETPRLQRDTASDYAASSTAERHAAKASARIWRWVAAEIR